MRTQICITADIEFTIGGAFADPTHNQPVGARAVNCDIDGRSHGLGFILEILTNTGIPATFFVEALNTHYFGDAPMGEIARQIATAGHDVQLHTHPCWTHFRNVDWQQQLESQPPNDSMAGRSLEELDGLLKDGIDTFRRWGLPRPTALRTGGLQVDRAVYQAMHRAELMLASNIGLAVSRPADETLQFACGRHWVDDVLELPVLSYAGTPFRPDHASKCLSITGTSWPEMESLLWQAHRENVSPVVILTHPSEFIKHQDVQYSRYYRNRINQSRFASLCSFLQSHPEQFEATTFSQAAPDWLAHEASTDNPVLSVSTSAALHRMIENKLNDSLRWF